MERYTEKDAKRCFVVLAEALGKEHDDCYERKNGKLVAKKGCWRLDYNPVYGGVNIEEITNEEGAVTLPLGYERRTPREFCSCVNFALRVLRLLEEEGKLRRK